MGISSVDVANLTIETDGDSHNNIIQIDVTVTVQQNLTILLQNVYLNHTEYNWFFRAASKNLAGSQYWQTSDLFTNLPESSRTITSAKTFYSLDVAYSGSSPDNTFAHTSLNLGGKTNYTWELFVVWSLANDTTKTYRDSFLFLTTPLGNVTYITRTTTMSETESSMTSSVVESSSMSSSDSMSASSSMSSSMSSESISNTLINSSKSHLSSTENSDTELSISTLSTPLSSDPESPTLPGFTFATSIVSLSLGLIVFTVVRRKN